MGNNSLEELDLAALREDIPQYGLEVGDVGTVVFVHDAGEAYEVEFVVASGQTLAAETLRADQIEPVTGSQILHVRKLAQA